MVDLKEYKPITTIQLFEWEIFTTASIEQLETMLNSDSKFIKIGNDIIAKNQIKRCYVSSLSDMEDYISTLPTHIQALVKKREQEKIAGVWRWFDNIKEIQLWIKDNVVKIAAGHPIN